MAKRKQKLVVNLLLILLLLGLIWLLEDRPLPWRLEYRAMEDAHFLNRKEILWEEYGTVLSRDQNSLYLFSGNRIYQQDFENGAAWLMEWRPEELVFHVADETGKAVRAELTEHLDSNLDYPDLTYRAEAAAEDGLFHLSVREYYDTEDMEDPAMKAGWRSEVEHFRDIPNYLYYGNVIFSDFELTITLYDESGQVVTEIKESGQGRHPAGAYRAGGEPNEN